MGRFSDFVSFITSPAKIVETAVKVFGKMKGWKIGNWITAIQVGMMVISWLRKPDIPDSPTMDNIPEQNAKGVLVNKTSANAPIPIIYGQRKVGGVGCFIETSGTDNTYSYMAIVLGEGEINDITEIRVDDKAITWSGDIADNTQRTVGSGDGNFYKDSASLITVEPHYGSDSQSASTLLSTLSSWGTNHRLRGIAYLALRFTWNQDAFSGIPKVHAVVQGK